MTTSFLRSAIQAFSIANKAYINATVAFYTVDDDGVRTETLATLYKAVTGSEVHPNPITLDSSGKFESGVYIDTNVQGVVSESSVGNHETGIIFNFAEASADYATDAQNWATYDVDETVPGGGGEFSAKHYATKSSDYVDDAAALSEPHLPQGIFGLITINGERISFRNLDTVANSGWVKDQQADAENLIQDFKTWIEENKDEITALQIFYDQPYRRRELTYKMLKDLSEQIIRNKPTLAPLKVWKAYEQLESVTGQPKNELIALVSLIRRIAGLDASLTTFDKTVDKNFADWVWKKQQGATFKFTKEQMNWLYLIRDHIATSVHLEVEDLDYTPFDSLGGRGKLNQLFGAEMETIIEELNEALIA
jgi:hypothetical protein